MRIAVSSELESGNVSAHFGHAEAFTIYDVEEQNIISKKVVPTNGRGHSVMVSLMVEEQVNVVLCGWMGGHAYEGLKDAGIEAYTGAEGTTDEALRAYFDGKLEKAEEGAGCAHDHCGCHEETKTLFEGKNAGKTCSVHYTGTFNDGQKFDSSLDRGEPLTFTCAVGQMIPGFDRAVADMEIGQEIDVHLMPEEAYGLPNPDAIFSVEIAKLPGSEQLSVGQRLYLQNQFGQPFPVTVTEKDDTNITFDANHEMAGKELNFHIQLLSVE